MNNVDTNKTNTINHLSLCTGYEGIGRGLREVLPNVREIAYVEIEAFAIANLANKMETGKLHQAPIYTNLKTFPYRKFRGQVDIISGGFPCQPFSQAGSRKATEDSEHWKSWVIEQRREYSQRVKSASHIREKESTSLGWPTASVAGCVEGGVAKNVEMNEKGFSATRENGTKYGAKLRDAVIHHEKNWSTPTTMDSANIQAKRKNHPGGGQKPPLCQEVKNWGTPKEQDSRAKMEDRGKHNLGEQVQGMHNFPTPQASDGMKPAGPNGQKMLCNSVHNFPTPTSRDWKGAYPKKNQEEKPRNLLPDAAGENTQQDLMKGNTNGKNQGLLKLNPSWVEQLMGLPVGWTDFDSSEME